jgi:hypothetical protein
VDALRDRFGVSDRELLPRVGEPPVEVVFWQTTRIGVVAATTPVEPSWLFISST